MSKGQEDRSVLNSPQELLFAYLRDVIYDPTNAKLNIDDLPFEYQKFAKGLVLYVEMVTETNKLVSDLAEGNLDCKIPSRDNPVAAPMKMLHASLKHLTWQAQQVANGDYQQRVDFMGDFSLAFNKMIRELEKKQKINQAEKSKLERYVHSLLTNSPDPILLFDKQGRAIHVSNAYLQIYKKYNAHEIQGKQLTELFAPIVAEDFLREMQMMFEQVVRDQKTIKTEQNINFISDDQIRHYQIQIIPMLDEMDNLDGVMMLFYDTTKIIMAREKAEEALIKAEQASQAKTDFLASMSHEMRTPMNAIIGMTTIFKQSSDPLQRDHCITQIEAASHHLLGVINDILDMSRIEAHKFDLSFHEFNFKKMIANVTGLIMFGAKERQQELLVEIDPTIPEIIYSDEQRLSQVISNLLSNAIKFTPDGGKITIIAKKINEDKKCFALRIAVKDTGIGISKEEQARLFKAFEQADGSVSRKYGGTGLGLAISREIITMMKGKIWVKSKPNQGSTFFVELPVQKGKEQVLNVDACAAGIVSDDGIFADKKIILAEDDEINREILVTLLEHTKLQIDPAVDGAVVIERFTNNPSSYDLILMDIHMPGVDGYEATKRIRAMKLKQAKEIPIIAVTANVFQSDIDRCLACGMNGHIGKPINIDEVIKVLKDHLL